MSEDHPVGEAPGDGEHLVEEDVPEQARRIADSVFPDEWLRETRKRYWDKVTDTLAFINHLDVALELREKRRGQRTSGE